MALLPTATLPKLRADGATANCAAPTPLPDSETVEGSAAPATTIDKLPVVAPADLGAKPMVTVEEAPGVSTIGRAEVLAVKLEPAAMTWEKVTLGPPLAEELVSVMVLFLLLPTDTFPKSILEVFSVRLALVVPAVWLAPAVPPPLQVRDRLNRLVNSLGGASAANRDETGQQTGEDDRDVS